MAEFITAYNISNKNEGGYVSDPKDDGRETYAGISRRYFPLWRGWSIIDSHKPLGRGQVINDVNLKQLIKQFYYDNIWKPANCDNILNQNIANQVYDFVINSGGAEKQINIALSLPASDKITADTLKALNGPDPIRINNLIASQRIKYLQQQNVNGEIDKKFMAGLIARAKRYIIGNPVTSITGVLLLAGTVFF